MREIKFRAWDGDHMHYTDSGEDNAIWRIEPNGPVCFTWQVMDSCPGGLYHKQEEDWGETPGTEYMEYSGFKDRNRRDIYEGDLVNVVWYTGLVQETTQAEVKVENGCFVFDDKKRQSFTYQSHMTYEVIGNIHQEQPVNA